MKSPARRLARVARLACDARAARVAIIIGALGVSTRVSAQVIWDGGASASDPRWSTASNWNPDTTPGNPVGALVRFSTGSGSSLADPTSGPWTVNGLDFTSGAGVFFVSSTQAGNLVGTGGIAIGTSGISVASNNTGFQTVNSALTLTGTQTWQTTGNDGLIVGSATVANGGFTLTTQAAAATSIRIQSALSGTGGLTINNNASGTTMLSGVNSGFSGTTTLTAGILDIQHRNALGTGAFNINGGTIQNGSGDAITLAGNNAQTWGGNFTVAGTGAINLGTGSVTITGNRTVTVSSASGQLTVGGIIDDGASTFGLVKAGAGTLTLAGANTFGGGAVGVNLTAGTLNINNASALGAGTFTIGGGTIDNTSGAAIVNANNNAMAWNGNFTFTGTNNLDLGTGAVTLNANRAVTVTAGVLTVGGAIADANFSLTKNGAGTLTLSGANSHNSGTILNAGTLNINNASALGQGTFTIAGGTIDNTSGAAITNTQNNAQSWSGNFTYGGSGDLNLGTGGVTLTANRTITTNGSGILTVGGIIADANFSLTKNGTGTLTLSGANSHNSGTILNAGTLNINNASALGQGTFTIAGGTIDNTSGAAITNTQNNAQSWTGDFTFAGTNNLDLGTGAVTLNANRAVTVTAGVLTVGGAIADGNFSLTKNGTGTLVLSGANSHNNGTVLNAGTLSINNASALGQGTLTINGGTIDTAAAGITNSQNNAQNWSGSFTFAGSGNLNLGTGAINLQGANRAVNVAANTLTVGGVLSNGSLTKEGAGTLTLAPSASSTYTGNTTIRGGTLALNASAMGNNGTVTNNIINNGSRLVLAGGTLQVIGDTNTTITTNQSFNNTTIASGASNITRTVSGTNQTNIVLGNLTREAGGTLNINTAATTGNVIVASASNTTTNGLLGSGQAFATITNNTWVTVSGNSLIGATLTNNAFTTGVNANVTINRTGGTSLTNNVVNSIAWRQNANRQIAIVGNLTIESGGLMSSNAVTSTSLTFTGGNIIAGGSGVSRELAIFTYQSGGNFIINSNIIDGGSGGVTSLSKSGGGNLILGGTNTYTGNTYLNAGTLVLGSNTALGASSSTFVINGGNINVNATRTLANNNAQQWNGDFGFIGSNNLDLGTGAVTLGGNRTVTVTANTLTVGGVIGDGGNAYSLTKAGAGTLTLNGVNTYTGGTNVTAGNLTIGTAGSLASTGNVTVSGGTLNLNNTAGQTVANLAGSANGTLNLASGVALRVNNSANNTFAGNITGAGSLTKDNTGTLTLSNANANYSGGTTIANGALSVATMANSGSASNIGTGNITLGNGTNTGTLVYTGQTGSSNRNISLGGSTGGGAITANGTGALTLSGTVTGTTGTAHTLTLNGTNTNNNTLSGVVSNGVGVTSVTKSDVGTWVFSNANTYTGTTTVSGGNLTTTGSGTIGASTSSLAMNGGTLNLNGADQTVANLTGTSGTIALGSTQDFTVNNSGANSYSGSFSGTGNLVKAGAGNLTLSGASTNTGNISITQGNLIISGNTSLGDGNTGTITVTNGAKLILAATSAGTDLTTGRANLTLNGAGLQSGTGNIVIYRGDITLGSNSTITNAGTSNYFSVGTSTDYDRSLNPSGPPPDRDFLNLGAYNLTFNGTGTTYVNSRITGTGNVTINTTNSTDVVGFTMGMNTFTGILNVDRGTLLAGPQVANTVPNDPANPGFFQLTAGLVIGNSAGGTAGGDVKANYVYDAYVNTPAGQDGAFSFNMPVTVNRDGRWDLEANQSIGALTFNGGRIDMGASGLLNLNGDVVVNATAGNTAYITGGSSATGLSLTIHKLGSTVQDVVRNFTVQDSSGVVDDLRIEARVTNGGIVKAGNGTMTMSHNDNNYALTTTVNDGILKIEAGGALGAGGTEDSKTTVNAGGTLQLANNITVLTEKLYLNGTDLATGGFGSNGNLNNLSGNNTWAGTVDSNYGKIQSQSGTLLTINGTLTTINDTTVRGQGNTTLSGVIGGAGNITKADSGTLVISGAGVNTYSGTTNVTGGVLHIQKNSALGVGGASNSTATTINSGASLYVSGGLSTTDERIFIAGNGTSGQGAIHNFANNNTLGGQVIITSGANNTLTSTTGNTLTVRGLTSLSGLNSTSTYSTSTEPLFIGSNTNQGTISINSTSGNVTGYTGYVGATHITNGTLSVGGGGAANPTVLKTAELTSGAVGETSATLTIGSGGTVSALFDNGATSNFYGTIGASSTGTLALTGAAGTSSAFQFHTSFTASNLTLQIGGQTQGSSTLSNYFRLELSNVDITVGTIHITGDTILDFNGFAGTSLTSTNLIIDAGVNIRVENWISTANNENASTIWRVLSGVQGSSGNLTLSGGTLVGNSPLNQITFINHGSQSFNYNGLTTTWVSGTPQGWFNQEIRPTPEPSTYGAILLTGCFGFIGWRRYKRRKTAAQAAAGAN